MVFSCWPPASSFAGAKLASWSVGGGRGTADGRILSGGVRFCRPYASSFARAKLASWSVEVLRRWGWRDDFVVWFWLVGRQPQVLSMTKLASWWAGGGVLPRGFDLLAASFKFCL